MMLLILYGPTGVAYMRLEETSLALCEAAAALLLRVPVITHAGCYGFGVMV